MKGLLIFFTVFIAIINFIFLYERDFGRGGFGPAAIFVEVVLVCSFLLFFVTVILYETRFRETITDKIRGWTERHLYLIRLILFYTNKPFGYKEFSVRRIVAQANFEVAKHTLAEDADDRREQWHNIFDSIQKIKKFCDANSIKFIVTHHPWGHQVNEKEWVPGRYNRA